MTDNDGPVDVIVVGAGKWAHECWAPLLREFTRRYRVLGVELAHGSVTCRGPQVTVTRDGASEDIDAPDADMFSGHRVQLAAFADWVRGGPAVETTLTDNLRSLAALFAAVESARTGTTVPVHPLGYGLPP